MNKAEQIDAIGTRYEKDFAILDCSYDARVKQMASNYFAGLIATDTLLVCEIASEYGVSLMDVTDHAALIAMQRQLEEWERAYET